MGTWRGRRPVLWGGILSVAEPPARSPEGLLGPMCQDPRLRGWESSPGHCQGGILSQPGQTASTPLINWTPHLEDP